MSLERLDAVDRDGPAGPARQYGGVWAQNDARKDAGIAGAIVLEDVELSIPQSVIRFAETHPADDAEVAAALTEAVKRLAAQTAPAAV